MNRVTAKDLKNRTGEILRRVGQGERVVITRRGVPHAVLMPIERQDIEQLGLRPLDEAWKDIEATLRRTHPRWASWQEAMRWSRPRPRRR